METKSPAVLWYTSDFLTGTNLMSNEQLGKYTRALCYQHQQGHLTEEDMLLICKTYDDKIYSKFIKDKDGKYYNKRMDIEIEKRNNFSKSRSLNRKGKPNKTGNKQQCHMNNISNSYEHHMDNENENDNDNENINISNNDIFNYIENKLGRTLSSTNLELINSWLSIFPENVIKDAINKTVEAKTTNLNYTKSILQNSIKPPAKKPKCLTNGEETEATTEEKDEMKKILEKYK